MRPARRFNGARVIDAQTDEVLFDQPMEERALRALVGTCATSTSSPGSPKVNTCTWSVAAGTPSRIGTLPLTSSTTSAGCVTLSSSRSMTCSKCALAPRTSSCALPSRSTCRRIGARCTSPSLTHFPVCSRPTFYFEFMAPGINKGNALAGSLPKIGIDASEVIAFGDAQNDISMLEWAASAWRWAMRPMPPRLRPMNHRLQQRGRHRARARQVFGLRTSRRGDCGTVSYDGLRRINTGGDRYGEDA